MMKLQPFEEVDFNGFKDNIIEQIKEDCLRFINFKFTSDGKNYSCLTIDGVIFGNNNRYYLHEIKDGFDVQVTPKHRHPGSYEYGIYIFEEYDMIKFIVYHNAHGPFT